MNIKNITLLLIVFAVLSGSTVFAQTGKTRPPRKTQRVSITLTKNGYRPESFRLRRGIPAKLTFVRTTDETCGQMIVIPAYGVHRDLPLNQPVTIKFTPRKNGTFNFTCGMDMLRGQIVVN